MVRLKSDFFIAAAAQYCAVARERVNRAREGARLY